MIARIRQFVAVIGDAFWLLPAAMVLMGVISALMLLRVDRSDMLPSWVLDSGWLYDGGGTGARTLLGTIASSTIGVAGTVFSITIAALSLAAGQMGPRLLRNFTRDRGNQFTLGALLGTFSYALIVLRSVRGQDEGSFVPSISLAFAMLLAGLCVATLVYFVGHMASRINVDTVLELVAEDIRTAMDGLIAAEAQTAPPPEGFWRGASPILEARWGYLQELDESGLADWAAEHGTAVRLLVRRGDFVFPGTPIAIMTVAVPGAEGAIQDAVAFGSARGGTGDLGYAVRQLTEVAVRALSSGINDPHTALSVLDRLGKALCDLAGQRLPSGVTVRDGSIVLSAPTIDYASLVDVMFNLIRQNASAKAAVLIRMLDVLSAVLSCETEPDRRVALLRHAEQVWADAQRTIGNAADLAGVERSRSRLLRIANDPPLGGSEALGLTSVRS